MDSSTHQTQARSGGKPHDAFCKRCLKRPMVRSSFYRAFLGGMELELLDLGRVIEVGSEFHERERLTADICHQVETRAKGEAVVVIFEHASRPGVGPLMQTMRYGLTYLMDWKRQHPGKMLPGMKLLVVYSGKRAFLGSGRIESYMNSEPIFIPDFAKEAIQIVSMRDVEDERVRPYPALAAMVYAYKYYIWRTKTYIEELKDALRRIEDRDLVVSLMYDVFDYLTRVCSEKEEGMAELETFVEESMDLKPGERSYREAMIERLREKVLKEVQEQVREQVREERKQERARALEKGVKKGREEGVKEGLAEARTRHARSIAERFGVSLEEAWRLLGPA